MSTFSFSQSGVCSLGCTLELDGKEFLAEKVEIILEAGQIPKIRLTQVVGKNSIIFKNVQVYFRDMDGDTIEQNAIV